MVYPCKCGCSFSSTDLVSLGWNMYSMIILQGIFTLGPNFFRRCYTDCILHMRDICAQAQDGINCMLEDSLRGCYGRLIVHFTDTVAKILIT